VARGEGRGKAAHSEEGGKWKWGKQDSFWLENRFRLILAFLNAGDVVITFLEIYSETLGGSLQGNKFLWLRVNFALRFEHDLHYTNTFNFYFKPSVIQVGLMKDPTGKCTNKTKHPFAK